MMLLGSFNNKVQQFVRFCLPCAENVPADYVRPTGDSQDFVVEKWIRDKYERKLFCPPDTEPPTIHPQVYLTCKRCWQPCEQSQFTKGLTPPCSTDVVSLWVSCNCLTQMFFWSGKLQESHHVTISMCRPQDGRFEIQPQAYDQVPR